MSKTRLDTDRDGRVLGGNIHDSVLIGLSLEAESRMVLQMARDDGFRTTILFSGLSELRITEIFINSIVSDLFAWTVSEIPEELWKVPDAGWRALFGSRSSTADIAIMARKTVAVDPSAILLQIDFSYGGSISVVCDDFSLSSKQT